MKKIFIRQLAQLFILMLPLMAGCTALLSKQSLQTIYYSLEGTQSKPQTDQPSINTNIRLPTLIISIPKAAAGFNTQRMMYTRARHQLEYFARNEWIDTPAKMLQPLMVLAIENTRTFNAVLSKQSALASDLRLESEVIKLVQNFNTKPSHVQFTLRATMIDSVTNKVIATREFDERVDAISDNPIAGVVAANLAVNQAIYKLSVFSQQTAINWSQSKEYLQKNYAN